MRKCTVTVASNMSEETYSGLQEKIGKKFGDDITFCKKTDDGIIGGFIIDLDGMIYDVSLSSQLSEMKKHIKGV